MAGYPMDYETHHKYTVDRSTLNSDIAWHIQIMNTLIVPLPFQMGKN